MPKPFGLHKKSPPCGSYFLRKACLFQTLRVDMMAFFFSFFF